MTNFRLLWAVLIVALSACGCAVNKPATVAANPTPIAAATVQPRTTPTPTLEEIIASLPKLPEVRAVEFSPDRKWLAVGTLQRGKLAIGGTIAVRECATNRVIKTWKVAGGAKFLAFSPDGKNIAATGAANKLLVWNWKKGRILHQASLERSNRSDSYGRTPVAYSPDGRTIAVGGGDVPLFDTRTWKNHRLINGGFSMSKIALFSPDGRDLLTVDDFDGYAGYTLYSLPRGKVREFNYFFGWSAAFSRNGGLLAGSGHHDAGSDDSNSVEGTFIFEARTLRVKHIIKSGDFVCTDFSPDSRFLAGRGDDGIEIWDIARGRRTQKFDDPAQAVVWLDAKTLLAGDENGVRKLRVKTN